MKKIGVLLFAFCFIFPLFAFGQAVQDPSFLREDNHYKEVARQTEKLEKDMDRAKSIIPSDLPEQIKEDEEIKRQEELITREDEIWDEETEEDDEDIFEHTAEVIIDDDDSELRPYSAFIISLNVTGGMQFLRAKDQFARLVKLTSSPTISGDIGLGYRISKHFGIVSSYAISRISYSDFDQYTITQDKNYSMGGRFGTRFYFAESFSIDLMGSFEQSYIVIVPNPNTIVLERFNHFGALLGVNYTLIDSSYFFLSGRSEARAYFPVSKTNWKTSTGHGFSSELNIGTPVGYKSYFYVKLGASYHNLKPTISTQYGITAYGGAGFVLNIN